MTNWLRWRLSALLGASLLVSGATYLCAQGSYPLPAKTPEEAGELFYQLLRLGREHGIAEDMEFEWVFADTYKGAISRAQTESFSQPFGFTGEPLFALLAKQGLGTPAKRTAGTNKANGQNAGAPATAPPMEREVVVVAEDGGYRVDLKATLGRWNNWSGERLDLEWFKLTQVMAPSLTRNSDALRAQCQMRMKQQMLGVLQYTQDYDERFPPARKWVEVLQPYVKTEQIFKCPSLSDSSSGYGYAYNQNLSQLRLVQLSDYSPKDYSRIVSIYETSNPKRNWFGPGTGAAYRHFDGWNLAFIDGHAKWFKRDGGKFHIFATRRQVSGDATDTLNPGINLYD